MENPEEILHSLEEFSKMKPKDIPRELEEYLCYVAKTGNPIYQWQTIKSLFREKLLSVITEFYEACPAVDIPPCPNVEMFNYELMKNFILEKLDTFSAAPFTVQRISELLTSPRKEYNRIDKYMRALEKNILVVSTMEPGSGRRSTENGEGIVNGIESEHLTESGDANHDINVEEMDESPTRVRAARVLSLLLDNGDNAGESQPKIDDQISVIQENFDGEQEKTDLPSSSNIVEPPEELIQQETIITCQNEEDSQPHYLAFDNDTLNSSNNEQHTEIQHQPPQEPQILTEENPVEKPEESEKIESSNNEKITKVEGEKTPCESDADSEENPPPPEESTTNEALPSVPCSDSDDKLSIKNVEKPSEELTVTESGLPQEETGSFEDENVEQNSGVIIAEEEKVKDEEKTENVESSSTVKYDVAEVESKVEENALENKEKCNEVIVNDDCLVNVSKNNDIPMEIDIVNEAEIDKQPSSTSEDTFI